MTGTFRPIALRDAAVPLIDPQAIVETFLAALAAGDIAAAAELVDERILYVNVGLPAVRGRRATMGVLRALGANGPAGFEVYLHGISASGATVLTDRTDVVVLGPLRLQFWVTGRFEVRDGRITLWRDSFDYVDLARAFVRGMAGVVVPALRPAAPESPNVQPGRH